MTFTHDDIQNRLIEFLYEELDGGARAAFEAHLTACERCRGDVAEFQKTRDVARAAVRVGLEDEVPAGVRARILEAAAAAVKVKAPVAAASAAATAARAAVKKPLAGEGEPQSRGPFAWLRARWAVPMFVTVAAMGALLLVRETIYREARKPLGETPVPEATVSPATAPPSGAAAPAEAPAPRDGRAKVLGGETGRVPEESLQRERWSAPAPMNGVGAADQPRAAGKVAAKAKGSQSKATSAPAKAGGPPPTAKKARLESLLSGVEKEEPAKRELNDDILGGLKEDEARTRGFAQPPPPRAVAAPRAPAPVAPAAPPTPSSAPSVVMDTENDAAPSQTLSPRQKKRAISAKAEEAADEAAPAMAAAPVSASADGDEDRAQPDAAAPLAARAEKLMASRQWAEAAAAYRQLIARFPKHEQVPNWRRRLAVIEAAAARAAPSK